MSNLAEMENRESLSETKRALLQRRLRQSLEGAAPVECIQPRAAGAVVPISTEQRRIWLHAETNADLPLYNEAITIHRRGEFNLATMEATLTEILRRHEAWRASVDLIDGELVQVIAPELVVRLPLVDLCHLPQPDREAECLRIATADAALPIALNQAPLFRAQVVRMAEDEHRLLLTLHHLIFDGVSIYRILMPELAAIYEAFSRGQACPLAEPALQYGDYALWRKDHVNSAAVLRNLEYWKRELAGPLPVLNLPGDHARPAQMSHRGSMECFRIPARLLGELRARSQAHGVTLYMTLLAAFKVLLFRYTSQTDLIVGGATDARRRPELENLMGYFLDTFAVRTRPQPETTFATFLSQVKHSVLGALSAVDVPFDTVVHAVQPQRNSSHHPLFQVFFSIEPPVAPFAEGWDLTQMDVTVSASKFDLYLELDERPDHMAARIMYSTDLFDAATIRRMAQHWLVLLDAVCVIPECSLATLPLLTPGEQAEFACWNDTQRPMPEVSALQLIRQQAERTPAKTAAIYEGTAWSYAELMARADCLSRRLHAAGVSRGSLVALALPRSLDLLAGMIAIWQAGAAYLPLDPDVPAGRLALCIDDAQPAAILTDSSLQRKLPADHIQVLTDVESELSGESKRATDDPVGPEDLAYVIHTSGTTGRPKAVEISHASLVNLLLSMQSQPGCADDVLLAVTTVSFDIAALELFLPLISGGTVCIASRTVVQDPQLLAERIESSGCTLMQATPATWLALLAGGWRGPSRRLKVLCGGESLPQQLAERLLALNIELWNVYGPTETTVWSTIHRVDRATSPILIGRPIANTTAHILDRQMQPVPVGVPGKLYLGGRGLARGYRNAAALTAERFVQLDFGRERLYDTGDLAVWRSNGAIECLGRTDHQVKVRGFRVELEAVEAAARRHPTVAAAAARVWQRSDGSRLSVYLVGKDGPPPDAGSLRRFLQIDQPDYMIPSDIIPVAELPLSLNGKLDRSRLPEPVLNPTAENAPIVRTPLELRIAQLWSEVLGSEVPDAQAVPAGANFFDLGGHSLLVATLQHKIHTNLGHRFSLATLFHAPTVEQQAELMELAGRSNSTGLVQLQPRGQHPGLFWLNPPPLLRHLAAALGEDQPLLGVSLTAQDLTEMTNGATTPTIQGIAARHVKTILKAQAKGPYYLGGLCTGGIVAYETAVQLRAAGHDVALLTLLDAQNPAFYRRIGSLATELDKLRFYLRQALMETGPRSRASLIDRLSYRIGQVWPPSVVRTEVVAGEHLTDAAALRYQPTRYDGRVLLLQPTDRPRRVNHLHGWQTVAAGELIAQDVRGHHDELLHTNNVAGVAEAISTHIAAAKLNR